MVNKKFNCSVLIACAMEVEASIFIEKLKSINKVNVGNFKFYEGIYNGYNVVVLVSNPGLINMASGLIIGIVLYNPSIIFNYGVVGGIGNTIHQGDIVVCNECMNIGSYLTGRVAEGMGVDINKWEFMTFTDGGVDELVLYKADSKLLDLVSSHKNNYDNGNVWGGRIGSSDVWDQEYDKLVMLRNKYNIICEDMECISVYQVADNFRIPAISIKVISDNVFMGEEYDKSVLEKSSNFVLSILNDICNKNLTKK